MCAPYLDITANNAYCLHHVQTCVLHVRISLPMVLSNLCMSRQHMEHVVHGTPHVLTSPSMFGHWSFRMTMSTDISKLHRERVLPRVRTISEQPCSCPNTSCYTCLLEVIFIISSHRPNNTTTKSPKT
ncbi:hypothetical protein SLA2020_417990 [Shorea laevis]